MDKNDCRLCVPYINQSTVAECGEEFTLPDYYPEIKRVVSTLCRVLPEGHYDSGDAVEQGGVVALTVLYLGDDGSLSAAPLTTDFSAVIQLPKGERSPSVISVDTTVENVTCRCSGPRRINARVRLKMTVIGEEEASVDMKITDIGGDTATAAEISSVQKLVTNVPSSRRATGRVTGNLTGEMHERPGTKPVMCDGEIAVNEAVVSDNSVILRGDAMIWCISFGGDGLYYKAVAKAPFEERLPLEGASISTGCARGFGRCAAVSVKEAENGTLLWDMEYDLECEATETVPVDLVADAYSTMWQGNVTLGECEPITVLRCHTGRLSVSAGAVRNGEGSTGEYVIGSYGKAVCDKAERVGDKLVFSGNADVKVIVCGGGEAVEECVRIPFRYETDRDNDADGELMWRCDVSVTESSARLEGRDVQVTAELCISVFAAVRSRVSYVTKLELDRGTEEDFDRCALRIYYPSSEESAWDITKKYRIPMTAVDDVSRDGVFIE